MLSLEYFVWDSVTLEEYGSRRQESKINRRCFISLFLLSASLPVRRKKKHCWPGQALRASRRGSSRAPGGRAHIFPFPSRRGTPSGCSPQRPGPTSPGAAGGPSGCAALWGEDSGKRVCGPGLGEPGSGGWTTSAFLPRWPLRPARDGFLPAQKPRLPYQSIPYSPKISLPASKNTSRIPSYMSPSLRFLYGSVSETKNCKRCK